MMTATQMIKKWTKLHPKVKSVIIFVLILVCSFIYYHAGNLKRVTDSRKRNFEIQIQKLEQRNRNLSTLSEELLDEIDAIRDTVEQLKNREEKIKIIYVEKYKNIDKFTSSDIINEFKTIFPDSIH